MPFTKLDQHLGQIPQSKLLVRRLACSLRLAHQTELEPQPVLGGLSDAGNIAAVDLDAADELVEGVLVGVGGGSEVADALVVLGKEAVAEEFGEAEGA